jgi:hypothetical protein
MEGFTSRKVRQMNRTQVSATNFIKYNVTSYVIQYKIKNDPETLSKQKQKGNRYLINRYSLKTVTKIAIKLYWYIATQPTKQPR